MKRSAGKIFIRGFVQSFFIVIFLLGAGVLGYRSTMHLWRSPNSETMLIKKQEQNPITEASVDDISKNLIYCYEEDTKDIQKLVLEIFDCNKKELTYITLPLQTRFTMTDTLYKKLILDHPEMPQLIKLSTIENYFDESTMFDYGVVMVEDMLKIDISYYTVIPSTIYASMFYEKNITANEKEDKVTVEALQKDYLQALSKLKTEEDLKSYLEQLYKNVKSNLLLVDKMYYVESYLLLPKKAISYELLAGEQKNSGFMIKEEEVYQQLHGKIGIETKE